MKNALNATGRPIFFSMCEWGREKPYLWAQDVANSWRTTIDIKDFWLSFLHNLERQVGLASHARPGAWNDPDMLEVGNGGMSNDEYQSHFALWAALKSPLLIGCNLKNISAETMKILGNE
jgi:alpha-galactosidase